VDAFFEGVMVNAEALDLRLNRQGLLKTPARRDEPRGRPVPVPEHQARQRMNSSSSTATAPSTGQ
jgi:hypothetical protein